MRAPAAVCSILLSAAVPSAAQDSLAAAAPSSLCFNAKPKPACSAFLLTNFGAYVVAGVQTSRDSPLQAVWDYGFMANVGTRDAIGASVFASAFVSLGDAEFAVGPTLRYRRWLSSATSLEFGVGTPLYGPELRPGSILGLVRWSPAPWFAVSARPELVNRTVYRSGWQAAIGVEAGEVPGLIVGGATLLVLFPLLTGSGYGN